MLRLYALFYCIVIFVTSVHSNPAVKYTSADIQTALNKLNVLGSVLYIAAHPDDENTAVLAFMARERLYQTAYLSLTRGDGGQNLLGPEQGDLLGVIRTWELLAAREIDGAKQYFTRAIDFGYSKSADESLQKWDRQLLLTDMVHIIRSHRPDVIINRFTPNTGGHGHHLSSAILAEEAFRAAADPAFSSESLKETEPWQVKRMFWNAWRWGQSNVDDSDLFVNVGTYNPLLGQSYQEIAAKSRSMHKSQGFGSSPNRGHSFEYFRHSKGDSANIDIFDGIDTSWKRVEQSAEIQKLITELISAFKPESPHKSVPGLVKLYKLLETHPQNYWIKIKKEEVKNLLQMCSGLWIEAVALQESASPGESISIRTNVINRSSAEIFLEKISLSFANDDSLFKTKLESGKAAAWQKKLRIPIDTPYSQPFWLKQRPGETMFALPEDYDGSAIASEKLKAVVHLLFDDVKINYETALFYRRTDPLEGELLKPFLIRPDVSLALAQSVYIFTGNESKSIEVVVKAGRDSVSGNLLLTAPHGWNVTPTVQTFSIAKIDESLSIPFHLDPGKNAQEGEITVQANINGKLFNQEVIHVDYPHIPHQNILKTARARLIRPDILVPHKKIAYIMGSGDEIPQALQQIGMQVDLIDDAGLADADYSQYNAVICGVRAFNTRENLGRLQSRITEFVENGGLWIVQHNTRFGTQVGQIGPYSFTARGGSRISQEDTPIEILDPGHRIFNYPNKITQQDFDGWVQERGLYLAETWDENFTPLLAGSDIGEKPQAGGLLYAPYGKGVFIFSGLAWFRQLPAGVPGAYRLFVNMLCATDRTTVNANQ
jgi:LmbE family N-acetylglucosaminyl deacetylase